MKKLICPLLLISFSLFAAKNEIPTPLDESKLIISVIKDAQVEHTLENSTQFNECIKDNKFDGKVSATEREEKARKAEICFQKKLKDTKDPKALEKLSNSLGLESYGLITSNNNKEITEYLGDKLYKAMTGIDRKAEKTKEMLKFSNRKMIDQKVFIELYSNHLAKNVMFEVSRFCFENFRLISGTENSFNEHWEEFLEGTKTTYDLGELTDTGKGGFGSKDMDISDPQKAYEAMFKGITADKTLKTENLGNFFGFCSKNIRELCSEFKKTSTSAIQRGANACLAQARLQDVRKAIVNTQATKEQFENDLIGGTVVGNETVNQFVAEGENSFDNLSTVTSFDFLEGGKNKNNDDLAEKCTEKPEGAECEKFIQIGNSKDRAKHSVDLDLRLKKQVELARIRAMKNDDGIKKYLEENGYMELLEKFNQGKLTSEKIELEIEKAFDAKRVATLAAIHSKLETRQMTEEEAGDNKAAHIQTNIKDNQQERARMAQVILFNNIISSYITATNRDTKEVTRYGTAWRNEQKGLETEAKVDERFFSDFKQSFQDTTSDSSNVDSLSLLDMVLGKPEEKKD